MNKLSKWALAGCLALVVGCGDDDASNNGVNNGVNNGANNGANNGNASAAHDLGKDVFHVVYTTVNGNAVFNLVEFVDSGKEGAIDCVGLAVAPIMPYGTGTIDYADGSNAMTGYDVTLEMDGCLAVESGDNAPFQFKSEDLSGDDLPDTFTLNGRIQAITYDENTMAPHDGGNPPVSTYDSTAVPTCSDINFENVVLEIPALAPGQQEISNETESHNGNGYSSGIMTAECGGQKIRCDFGGTTTALSLINLDSVASASGRTSICVFE